MTLGGWLRSLRAQRGMSQEEVAFAAEIDVTTYGRIERAVCGDQWANPRLLTMLRLMRALGVTSNDLLESMNRPP
ncbi:helix-turn-helix transcriptional regulator [Microbacterium croceum]